MTEWRGVSLSNGTLLKYTCNDKYRIAVLKIDNTYQQRFEDINPNAKMKDWVITRWEIYDIATEAQAALYLLENL